MRFKKIEENIHILFVLEKHIIQTMSYRDFSNSISGHKSINYQNEKIINKDIYEYDEYGRLRRCERVSEYHNQTNLTDSGYRAVQNSDISWLNPAPQQSHNWQSDYARKLGISAANELKTTVTYVLKCPHGYDYICPPGHYKAFPVECDTCCQYF